MADRDEEIGQRIRELRKAAGLTQYQLSTAAGRYRSWMAKIEFGYQPLGLADAILVAAALDVPLTALAGTDKAAASREVYCGMEKSIRWHIAQQVLAGGPK